MNAQRNFWRHGAIIRRCDIMNNEEFTTIFAVPCDKPVFISNEQYERAREQAIKNRPSIESQEENTRRAKALFAKPAKPNA